MEVTRQMMLVARLEYEARYDGTRIERDIRHAASSLTQLSAALDAIGEPHGALCEAAGISSDNEDAWSRFGIVVLLYPYARHRSDVNFNFGDYAHRYAPRVRRSFDRLRAEDVPKRPTFVCTLRTILIRAKRHYAPVDWASLGGDVLRWGPATKSEWGRGWTDHDRRRTRTLAQSGTSEEVGRASSIQVVGGRAQLERRLR